MTTEKANALAVRVGAAVRRERIARGWTQHVLAMKAGLGERTHVSRIESGRNLPALSTLVALAEALGVRAGALIDEEEER